MHDVFVSRPTWVAPEFSAGLTNFLTFLESAELRARTLGATDYPNKCPLDEVIELMRCCKGAIILGYPQIIVTSGKVKDADCSGLLLPTEWNHIEATLAYSQNLPLLVIHHLGISRGIFDHGAASTFVHEIDLSQPDWPMQRAAAGALTKWKQDCLGSSSQRSSSAPQ